MLLAGEVASCSVAQIIATFSGHSTGSKEGAVEHRNSTLFLGHFNQVVDVFQGTGTDKEVGDDTW